MTKKLGDIDKIYMKEIIDKQFKGEIDGFPMLMMFYMTTGTRIIYCDAMAKISLETDPKKKDEMYKDLYLKQSEEECKVYREIYEKYNSMYQKIIDTNLYIDIYNLIDESNSDSDIENENIKKNTTTLNNLKSNINILEKINIKDIICYIENKEGGSIYNKEVMKIGEIKDGEYFLYK